MAEVGLQESWSVYRLVSYPADCCPSWLQLPSGYAGRVCVLVLYSKSVRRPRVVVGLRVVGPAHPMSRGPDLSSVMVPGCHVTVSSPRVLLNLAAACLGDAFALAECFRLPIRVDPRVAFRLSAPCLQGDCEGLNRASVEKTVSKPSNIHP